MKSLLGSVLFGLVFMLVGAFIAMLGLDIISTPDENFNAPRWVIVIVGLFFMVAGTMPMLQSLKQISGEDSQLVLILNNLVLLTFLLLFAVPFNWVAFGPGEREFTTTTSVGFLSLISAGKALSGRCVFGIGALFLDGLVIYSVIRFLRGDNLSQTGKRQ